MVIDLKDLRKIRTSLGLSQHELSRLANISQSMVAKIEQGRLDPSYRKAISIIDALENRRNAGELKANDIMVTKIISVAPDSAVQDAVRKMRKFSISQMLVMKGSIAVGYITESLLLDSMVSGKSGIVSQVMEEVPPIVSKSTNISVISKLLAFYQMVAVGEGCRVIGILTRSDVLERL